MKYYRALKMFSSPLVGGKIPGDIFQYGEESAKVLIDQGLIVEHEVKPAKEAVKEVKKAKKSKKDK